MYKSLLRWRSSDEHTRPSSDEHTRKPFVRGFLDFQNTFKLLAGFLLFASEIISWGCSEKKENFSTSLVQYDFWTVQEALFF
jgi:hypothetical protein